jgi:hypothetical protein
VAITLLLSQFAFGSDNISSKDKTIFSIVFVVIISVILMISFGNAFLAIYKSAIQKNQVRGESQDLAGREITQVPAQSGIVRVVSSSL